MTSEDTVKFSALAAPFATNGDRNVIGDDESSFVVNKATGIPEIFATDIMNGGKFIQRKDINGMAYLLSLFQYYMQVRAVVSFDQSVCNQIGGYPKGAILAYVDDSVVPAEMFFIESNNENNTVVPVPGETIDAGSPANDTMAWHKLTPSWSDVAAMMPKLMVVDYKPENPQDNTYYFIRGEGVKFT